MLKFVNSNVQGYGKKRKQSHHACHQCRKKKRRCDHAEASTFTDDASELEPSNTATTSVPAGRIFGGHKRRQTPYQHHQDENHSINMDSNPPGGFRFIGDLNPESVFRANSNPTAKRDGSTGSGIGTWLYERLELDSADAACDEAKELHPSNFFYGHSGMVRKLMIPILREQSLSLVPHASNLNVLVEFYFENIHPMFPIISRERYWALPEAGPEQVLLQQSICLAASLNSSVEQHLRLPNVASQLNPREYGKHLSGAIRTSIDIGLVRDKSVLIPTLCLMSLFHNVREGAESSLMNCARAVQYVQSSGLHLPRTDHVDRDHKHDITTFCCVFALDRLNAAFHGRSVMIHERDVGINIAQCIDKQEPCFRTLLQVVMLLDKTIGIYRPGHNHIEDKLIDHFKPFEDLITDPGSTKIPTPLLATIETLYHAVAILSCRSPLPDSSRRSSVSYTRQKYAASQIMSLVGDKFKEDLIMFPFIPYAVSLSLSIAYRELRYAKVPMYHERARADLETACNILERLAPVFWSASIMAGIGRTTIAEFDKANAVAQPDSQISQANARPTTSHAAEQDRSAVSALQGPFLQDSLDEPPRQEGQNDLYGELEALQSTDAFGIFGPGFDLADIDAWLEGNLDLSYPNQF